MMSMPVLVLIPLIALGMSVVLVVPTLCRLCRRCGAEEITPDWLENFSPASYYPMQGLLAKEDFRFLSRQPGFDLTLYRKLRRERLHIFRQYLNRMIVDFNRLHAAARLVLAHASNDHSHLLFTLVVLKLKFSVAVIQAEISYGFCRLGFSSLAARAMILHLEEMSARLGMISAETAI
jgi:hypothetical protein